MNSFPLKPEARPIAWTIASSDCSGGAGIQADIITMNRLGTYGCSVLTGITVQNTITFSHIEPVANDLINRQFDTLMDDLPPSAIKTGMLGSAEAINLITAKLGGTKIPVICDPVIHATLGTVIMDVQARVNLIHKMLPLTRMITPNTHEAALLTNVMIRTPDDMVKASQKLLNKGTQSVLMKGGHREGSHAMDYWTNGSQHAWLSSPRINTRYQHGTGCTLSAAITALIAQGYSDLEAVIIAKAYVNQGLLRASHLGQGRGPLYHGGWPDHPDYLPGLYDHPVEHVEYESFPRLDVTFPDVYPIVDRAGWIERLAKNGARMIQLRVKDLSGSELEKEVVKAIQLGRKYDVRVFINDHWQLALREQAYGVHLGQDDLSHVDFTALRKGGVRLGLSTHNVIELARSKIYRPSYTAIGTLFPSPSKTFAHHALGLAKFSQLQGLCEKPVVAIGGITLKKAQYVMRAGADIISVISDITAASDPENQMRTWRRQLSSFPIS